VQQIEWRNMGVFCGVIPGLFLHPPSPHQALSNLLCSKVVMEMAEHSKTYVLVTLRRKIMVGERRAPPMDL